MKVCVVGAGNVGMLMAAEFAARGHEVSVVTSRPQEWSRTVDVLAPDGTVAATGELACVTADLAEGAAGARYVFVTYPVYLFERLCAELAPVAEPGQRVCFVPGADAEFFCEGLLAAGAVVCGLQRVHSVARIAERGRSVFELGRKPSLQVAAIPAAATAEVAEEIGGLFEMPVTCLGSYLAMTLTPSNPVLHTSRIRTMFADWAPGVSYPENYLFYEGWDDAASAALLAADAEVQAVCAALPELDLSGVRPLTEHYESPDVPSMTHKISHIPAFAGLRSPMAETGDGRWEPDFGSRYFSADFAFGLKAIRDVAAAADVATPALDDLWRWYVDAARPERELVGVPETREGLLELYR
ncbi:NAD/NADP octopine/nopaline dehydrogenase family protein [Atopobiaceae bacterium 24-176]